MVALLTKSTMPIVKWVAEVMGWLMNGIYSIGVTNLGLCIILFTIIIYMFMTPLQIKQQKFSKRNAVMSTELQKINKKNKGKKEMCIRDSGYSVLYFISNRIFFLKQFYSSLQTFFHFHSAHLTK